MASASIPTPQTTHRTQIDRLAWLRDGKMWLRTIVTVFIVGLFIFPIYFWFLASFKPFGLIFTLPPVFFFEPTLTWYSVVLGGVPYNQVMLDLTGALAAWSGHDVARGMKASTVTLTVNFVGAAMGTAIVATGEVRRRGKELIFCDVEIVEDNDARRLVATGSMIYRIV